MHGPRTNPRSPGLRPLALAMVSVSILVCQRVSAESPAPQAAPRFRQDVRPILSDTCYRCHGPDAQDRQANLRLDQPLGERTTSAGARLVVPGAPDQSELYRRLISNDPDYRMPPPASERQLSTAQRETIQRWIATGAVWEGHWAFETPRRPSRPGVQRADWPANPLDVFVLHRLEREKLNVSPVADPAILFRRLTLDLTGLPPDPDFADAFVTDLRPDRVDRAVDRLLSSPRLGERLAAEWLDAARYADTSGYQNDGPREMWRWRDWVIDAFNRDQPFDQFTIEQLAGDLLPSPTRAQRIATGFNRNHRGNAEGGIIPEEYAVEYVVDRVETTMTVWQGLTIGCARCHDHKFDPISQREFYQLYAYFNSIPEFGRAIKEGNSPPYLSAPTDDDLERLKSLDGELGRARQRITEIQPALEAQQLEWEANAVRETQTDWVDERELVARWTFDGGDLNARGTEAESRLVGGSPDFAPGQSGDALSLPGGQFLAADVGNFGYFDSFSFGGYVWPRDLDAATIFSRMADVRRGDGYAVQIVDGRVQIHFVKRWLDDALRLQSRRRLDRDTWQHLFVTYDGTRNAQGVRLYVNGENWELDTQLDLLNQTFATTEPFRIGGGGGPEFRLKGLVDDVRIYRRALTAAEVAAMVARPLEQILAIPRAGRSPAEARKVDAAFLVRQAPPEIRVAFERVRDLEDTRARLLRSWPTVMVMEELPVPRPTFVLTRGQYDKPGAPVGRGIPGCLPPLPADAPSNRLGLARWLVDPRNPLTARVTVNRYWQMLFGTGIVKTTEDFGSQGEPPFHPELLDWLAVEFMTGGDGIAASQSNPQAWDLKRLLRKLVLSATYQQTSSMTSDQFARDPENRLLSRGPRMRLSAEAIRDQALVASGLFAEQVGGRSVKPYQPADLWKELATDNLYEPDRGAGLYRRGLYTYWKRTVSPPAMTTFDAGGRETCQVRRTATNTPQQSLALLNDVTYVEAARAMAERVLRETADRTFPEPLAPRIARMFQLVLGRHPTHREMDVLRSSFARYRSEFAADVDGAQSFNAVGAFPPSPAIDPVELAAYSAIASVILNLDEAITRQ